jgi:hypothetical protein
MPVLRSLANVGQDPKMAMRLVQALIESTATPQTNTLPAPAQDKLMNGEDLAQATARAMSTGTVSQNRMPPPAAPPMAAELWDFEDWIAQDPSRLDEAARVRPDYFKHAEVPLAPGDFASLAKLLKNFGRSHPKYVAAKKWFHGGTEGLESQRIDPFLGDHESLFGQGFYMTDEPKIARGYERVKGKGPWSKGPQTYEAELSVDRVLDLEERIPDEVAEIFRNRAKYVYDEGLGLGFVSEKVEKALAQKGATTESVFSAFRSGISRTSQELEISTNEFVVDFQELAVDLRNIGYDALTHTGGGRAGKTAHQVMIMLDPNDAYSQVGRGDQIRRFKPTVHE